MSPGSSGLCMCSRPLSAASTKQLSRWNGASNCADCMTAGYPLIFSGVLLNAAAQLLLKAGTNAVGRFEFVADNIVPVATRLAFEPHIVAGMVCYAVSLVVWIMGLSRIEVSI